MNGQAMDGESARLKLRDNLTGQGIILTTLALLALGVVVIHSTSATLTSSAWYNRPDVRQAMIAPLAMLILCTFWRFDYHRLARKPWPNSRLLGWVPMPAAMLMLLGLLLSIIVLVPGIGYEVGQQRRWLKAGPVQLQPSEVLKFALLIYLAVFLGRQDVDPRSFRRTLLPLLVLIAASLMLVIKFNFSTAAVMGVAAVGVLLMGGVRWYYLAGLAPMAAAAFYAYIAHDPRRWERIVAFQQPFDTSSAAAYQPGQALIWTSSGANPAGLGGGVAKYGYLPEDDTDFIFTTINHETGIIGAALVIGLVLIWLYLARRAVRSAPDRLGALLAGGIGFAICVQAAMHVAVTLVVVPPTGISLPFVSVGGTALLIMSAAAAVVISVSARRSPEG